MPCVGLWPTGASLTLNSARLSLALGVCDLDGEPEAHRTEWDEVPKTILAISRKAKVGSARRQSQSELGTRNSKLETGTYPPIKLIVREGVTNCGSLM